MKTTLLVLAAGMGSRFGGVKQVVAVGAHGETVLEYSVYDALAAGFDEIVFLIRAEIEADFRALVLNRFPASIQKKIAFQEKNSLIPDEFNHLLGARQKPWGTGHALLCAETAIKNSFAVINADDFYGAASFKVAHDFLVKLDPASNNFCMVGFELHNTTSPFGTVSRGVCTVDNMGNLQDVTEHTKIAERNNGNTKQYFSLIPDETEIELTLDTIVSMNLFGFTPQIFKFAHAQFNDFLAQRASDPKAEFFLPSIVDVCIKKNQASTKVLTSPDAWFGLTYKEDLISAKERIKELTSQGAYPSPLWHNK